MLVKSVTEEEIYGIGHAFGYYDYGEEIGMSAAFSGKEATANYICAFLLHKPQCEVGGVCRAAGK